MGQVLPLGGGYCWWEIWVAVLRHPKNYESLKVLWCQALETNSSYFRHTGNLMKVCEMGQTRLGKWAALVDKVEVNLCQPDQRIFGSRLFSIHVLKKAPLLSWGSYSPPAAACSGSEEAQCAWDGHSQRPQQLRSGPLTGTLHRLAGETVWSTLS